MISLGRSLLKEGAFSLIAVSAYAAQQWLLIKILLNYGGFDLVGWYGLVVGALNPVFAFFNANLRAVVLGADQNWSEPDFFRTRLISAFGATILCTGLLFCVPAPFDGARSFALTVIALKCIEAISDIMHGFYQVRHRMANAALASFVRLVLGSAVLYIVINVGGPVAGVAALVVASLLVALLFEYPSVRHLRVGFSSLEIRRALGLWRVALPMALVVVVVAVAPFVPRFMLQRYVSIAEVGAYYALSYLVMIVGLFATAIGTAAAPRLAEFAKKQDFRLFGRVIAIVLGLDLLLAVILWLAFAISDVALLSLLLGEALVPYKKYLLYVVVLAALTFGEAHCGVALTALRVYGAQLKLQLTKLVLLIGAAWFFIPRYGVEGAFIAAIVVGFYSLIAFGAFVKRALRI